MKIACPHCATFDDYAASEKATCWHCLGEFTLSTGGAAAPVIASAPEPATSRNAGDEAGDATDWINHTCGDQGAIQQSPSALLSHVQTMLAHGRSIGHAASPEDLAAEVNRLAATTAPG